MSQSRQQCHESCPCHTWGGRGCCDEDQTMKNEKHVEMRAWKCWAWWVKGPNTESCVRKHRGPRSWGLRRSKTNWKQWVQKHFPLCSIQCRVRSCHSSHWGLHLSESSGPSPAVTFCWCSLSCHLFCNYLYLYKWTRYPSKRQWSQQT